MTRKSRAKPPSPFRSFNSSPEVIRLVVMMYVKGTVKLTRKWFKRTIAEALAGA